MKQIKQEITEKKRREKQQKSSKESMNWNSKKSIAFECFNHNFDERSTLSNDPLYFFSFISPIFLSLFFCSVIARGGENVFQTMRLIKCLDTYTREWAIHYARLGNEWKIKTERGRTCLLFHEERISILKGLIKKT